MQSDHGLLACVMRYYKNDERRFQRCWGGERYPHRNLQPQQSPQCQTPDLIRVAVDVPHSLLQIADAIEYRYVFAVSAYRLISSTVSTLQYVEDSGHMGMHIYLTLPRWDRTEARSHYHT